ARTVAARGRPVGVEVMAAGELPPGWRGKNHALWRGAADAREDYVLFVDADLRVGPECVARAVGAAERARADLYTFLPRIEACTAAERAVQPLVAQLVIAWLPPREVNDPARPRAGACGPFLLFRRAAYEAI